MGDPAMRTDTTVTPPSHVTTPFMPQSPHPTTSDVEQMINSRVQGAVDLLRSEFATSEEKKQRNREIAIGIGGLVAGGVVVYTTNRIMASRRARAAAAGR